MSLVAVLGDGWAGLGSVAFALLNGHQILWIPGTSSSLLPPTLSFSGVSETRVLSQFLEALSIEVGEPQSGDFTVEYRNKSFREPTRLGDADSSHYAGVEAVLLSSPELRFMGTTAFEIERKLRRLIDSKFSGQVERIEGDPLKGFEVEAGGRVSSLSLGSGKVVRVDRVIYAADWGQLPMIEGIPKPIPLLRKRESGGAVQVLFTHKPWSEGAGSFQNYLIPVVPKASGGGNSGASKNRGSDLERHAVGYLIPSQSLSLWTVSLTAEELEDNHEISKRLKKLKQNLDRAFEGSDLFGGSFSNSLLQEQVRFVEEAYFKDHQSLDRPSLIEALEGIEFLTDGYGMTASVMQVSRLRGFSFPNKSSESPAPQLSEGPLLQP